MQTTEQRQQWLQERKTGIGGSDAAIVLGLSQWKTPLQLWQEKTGQTPLSDIDNPAMYWGRTLEAIIREHYQKETGTHVDTPPMMRHPKHDWMIANVDGLTSDGKILEIKTARSANQWGEEGSAEIPDIYALQVQHYMAVTDRKSADVAVLIGGSDFRIYHLEADSELQNHLITAEAKFWEMVKNQTPPAPTSFAEIQAQFLSAKDFNQKAAIADEHIMGTWRELIQTRHEIKDAQDREERYKMEISEYMYNQGSDTLKNHDGKILATNKATKCAIRFDTATFAQENPEIHQRYLKQSAPQMRLLIKN